MPKQFHPVPDPRLKRTKADLHGGGGGGGKGHLPPGPFFARLAVCIEGLLSSSLSGCTNGAELIRFGPDACGGLAIMSVRKIVLSMLSLWARTTS